MPSLSYEQAVLAVRAEISKYHDGEFGNSDDLHRDLDLISDDLSAIALALEKSLRVKLGRNQYREIKNVDGWARAIEKATIS